MRVNQLNWFYLGVGFEYENGRKNKTKLVELRNC
jgi:hypothetical protein